MKHIVSISLGSAQRDYSFTTTVLGQHIAVQRVGTDGNMRRAAELIRQYDGQVHAICLEDIAPVFRVGQARYFHREAASLSSHAHQTRVVDGSLLGDILERWAVKCAAEQLPGLFHYRRFLITSGLLHYQMAQALSAFQSDMRFADPLLYTPLPGAPVPSTLAQLELYAAMTMPFTVLLPYRMFYPKTPGAHDIGQRAHRLFRWADVIAGNF